MNILNNCATRNQHRANLSVETDPWGRMPERRLIFNPGFKPGTKLVPMPDSILKLVRMPEGRLTLDPGLALWIKAHKLVLL